MAQNSDKLSASDRMMLEGNLAALKSSVERTDIDTIRSLSDAILQDAARLKLKNNNTFET